MNRKQYNELKTKIEKLEKELNGGKGSGNFGHAGRPGEVGGSVPSGTAPQGKTSEKRAYDHLRNNYTELGFDASLVDTDFADDKAMTIFSSLESSDIMQLAEDKVKADDIYYALEGRIDKFYKEGRDNASNLQSYMQKTNDSINEAINEVISYGKVLAHASQLPEDTKKDFWLMDKDERSDPGNRARTLLDDAEHRLLRHEFDSEGFTEFAKVSRQRIQALREAITHYDEINERVLDAPRSDKIIQDPSKKTNSVIEKTSNGGKGSGNFGHAGRPGKVGGSASSGTPSYGVTADSGLSKDEEQELRELLTDRKSSYGGDIVETTKQVLKDHAWDREGISEGILSAYEDEARSKAGVPSRDEELGGVGVSYGEMGAVQGELDKIIDSKSLSDLTKDIGIFDMATAIELAQTIQGEKYARKMSEKMGEYSQKSDLEKFVKAFLPRRSDDIMDKAQDDVKQGWILAADRLQDSLDFVFGNSATRKTLNGGRGSGNFGHAGRPGKIGGSAPEGSGGSPKSEDSLRAKLNKKI